MGLTREARMSRSDFRAARSRRARRSAVGPIVLQVVDLPVPDVEPTGGGAARGAVRVGLVVGRRVGGAVQRNRVRRRLREAAAAVLRTFPGDVESSRQHSAHRETLVVVRAQPGIADMTVEDMRRAVDRGLRRALGPTQRRSA